MVWWKDHASDPWSSMWHAFPSSPIVLVVGDTHFAGPGVLIFSTGEFGSWNRGLLIGNEIRFFFSSWILKRNFCFKCTSEFRNTKFFCRSGVDGWELDRNMRSLQGQNLAARISYKVLTPNGFSSTRSHANWIGFLSMFVLSYPSIGEFETKTFCTKISN